VSKFQVGQKVKVKHAIFEPVSDYSPGGCLANAGDVVIVRAVELGVQYPIAVAHHGRDGSFVVSESEISPLKEADL